MKEERQKHLKKKESLQNVDVKKKSALGTYLISSFIHVAFHDGSIFYYRSIVEDPNAESDKKYEFENGIGACY
jgi:hypothetical protein